MKVSSAYKVQYDIRPSKQTERRLLLDILRTSSEIGINWQNYKYVGFGGFRFYDFEMLFRHLGIKDMASIELDKTLFKRCKFNKPYDFIDFEEGMLSDFLDEAVFRKPIVAWLDYDCNMSSSVARDVETLCAKVPLGSFIFATVDARIPDGMRSETPTQRLASVQDEYRDGSIANAEDLETDNFPNFAERVLWTSLTGSFQKRTDGTFVPLIRAFYKDTAIMATVGGCLFEASNAALLSAKLRRNFGFLVSQRTNRPYSIPPFNLTTKERELLNRAVTKSGGISNKQLKDLGFTKAAMREYQRMVRFIPKYVETYI